MQQNRFSGNYFLKLRVAYVGVLLVLFYRLAQGVLISHMQQPHLFDLHQNAYSLFSISTIPYWLTQHTALAMVFDVLLFAMPLIALLTANRLAAIASTVLLLVYMMLFNMAANHAYHGLIGAVVITIPFWCKTEQRFNLLWDAARYYWLYVFASAGLWKILRGSAFLTDQMSNILMQQQLDYLLQQPLTFKASVIQYLIAHPTVSHGVLLINVCLQLCFLAGFFTRRFDTALIILSVIFCLANYFVMSIVSTELLILNLTLINWDKIEMLLSKPKASIA